MNTFIISSKNLDSASEVAKKINEERKINKFDIDLLEFEKAIGIEDVRNIQKKIYLKPFKGIKKSIIIKLLNGATLDAQNSMLKLLEEPPVSSIIILITQNYQIFLPTILSRAKVIEIKDDFKIDKDKVNELFELDGEGDSLYLAQELSKDKNGAINWLENAILGIRELMLDNLNNKQKALKLRKMIHKIELTHYDLKNTNVNTRLALENLFLDIN